MASHESQLAGCSSKFVVGLALWAIACGDSDRPSTPSGPSTSVQVGGTWAYSLRLTSSSGGECVGADFQSGSGLSDSGTLEISQSNASLTATLRSDLVPGACSYAGNATAESFTLNLIRCESGTLQPGYTCANGAVRDIEYTGNAITATVAGTAATGTSVETYNVNAANSANRVGVLTLNWSLSATRR